MAAIALLDDYQNVALRMADWSRLQQGHRLVVFNERLPDVEACARALADFDVIGIMRERTPFPRALFERLPKLRLLITTGFLGGLTTFSTFSAEIVTLLLRKEYLWGAAAIAGHVVGSLAMTLLGILLMRAVFAWGMS